MFIFEELRSLANGFMVQPVVGCQEKNISLNLTASNWLHFKINNRYYKWEAYFNF